MYMSVPLPARRPGCRFLVFGILMTMAPVACGGMVTAPTEMCVVGSNLPAVSGTASSPRIARKKVSRTTAVSATAWEWPSEPWRSLSQLARSSSSISRVTGALRFVWMGFVRALPSRTRRTVGNCARAVGSKRRGPSRKVAMAVQC
jgi:hypothetical protein